MNPIRIVAWLPLVALACVKAGPAVKASSGPMARDFFALKLGAQWTYEIEFLGAKETRHVTMQRLDREGYFEDSTGAKLMSDAFGVRDQKRYLLRNPVEVGTRWTNVVSVSSVEHYEILATDEPCETRAGRWTGCVTVESRNRIEEGKTLLNELVLAPGVGIVKVTTILEAGDRRIPQTRLELMAFSAPDGA